MRFVMQRDGQSPANVMQSFRAVYEPSSATTGCVGMRAVQQLARTRVNKGKQKAGTLRSPGSHI
jgi:hypothetical protein